MAVVIRLARRGKRHHAFYRISVADSRNKPTGRFLQQIGYYDPHQEPPLVKIDEESALKWMQHGARPSETVQSLFRHQGIMSKFEQMRKGKPAEEAQLEPKAWQPKPQRPSQKVQAKQKAAEEAKAAEAAKAAEPKAEAEEAPKEA